MHHIKEFTVSTSLRAALLFSLNIFLWVTYSKESLIQKGLNRYKFASLICNCKEITASPNWKRLLFEPRLLMKWTRYSNLFNKKILKNLFKNVCFHLNFYSLNVSCLDLYQRSKKFAFYGPMAIPDTEYCRAILTFLLPEF